NLKPETGPNRHCSRSCIGLTRRVKGHEKASCASNHLFAAPSDGERRRLPSPTPATIRTPFAEAVVLLSLTASIRREVAPATSCRVPLRFSHPQVGCWRG